MAQIIPAPNPATNNAPGPVTLPASMDEQKAATDYVAWLAEKVHRPESAQTWTPFAMASNRVTAGGITVDHLLAGLEYMYHVLCGREDRPVERSEILPQYSAQCSSFNRQHLHSRIYQSEHLSMLRCLSHPSSRRLKTTALPIGSPSPISTRPFWTVIPVGA